MMSKKKRGALWIGVTIFWNLVFVAYLLRYTGGGGRGQFIGGLPEVFVYLVVLVGLVLLTNATLGWYYLGKPDIGQVFQPEAPTHETAESEEGA